ncbi:tetratricopeptide repeat protein [Deinococcus sp. Arct2-2]|uniref:tetratricopeptide repeat protein n=1 Tax=Deinococcus sp. Arct2-2 TaxID=2568653 RepID=UPI0010A318D5|nr:tetratricopeptide repeat protein [Deinococcus sp. Arct2-2]THF70144.1 tetratricopeptide repeat protein [Deinococcus sp. Arct2-2]
MIVNAEPTLWTLLSEGEYSAAEQHLQSPTIPDDQWGAVIIQFLQGHHEQASALRGALGLTVPPDSVLTEALKVALVSPRPLIALSTFLREEDARTWLERAKPISGALPRPLFAALLRLTMSTGNPTAVNDLLARYPAPAQPSALTGVALLTTLHAALKGASDPGSVVALIEALNEPHHSNEPLLWLALSAAAHQLDHQIQAVQYATRAFQLLEPQAFSADLSPRMRLHFGTHDDPQNMGVIAHPPAAWKTHLDTIASSDAYPLEMQAHAKLLRIKAGLSCDATQDLDEARGVLGESLLVLAVTHAPTGEILPDLRQFKAVMQTHLYQHGTAPVDAPVFTSSAPLDQDTALALHQELLHWPEEFQTGDGQGIMHAAQRQAWLTGPWCSSLEAHGMTEELYEAARTLLSSDGENPSLLFSLAFHAASLNTPEGNAEATHTYRTLLEHQPADTSAMNNLALLLQHEQQLDEARTLFEQVLALAPDHAQYVQNYVSLLKRVAERDPNPLQGARTFAQTLHTRWPERLTTEMLGDLLRVQVQAGDLEGAEQTLARPDLKVEDDARQRILAYIHLNAAFRGENVDLQALTISVATLDKTVELHLAVAHLAAQRDEWDTVNTAVRHAAALTESAAPRFYFGDLPVMETIHGNTPADRTYILMGPPSAWTDVFALRERQDLPSDVRGALCLLTVALLPEEAVQLSALVEQARTLLGNTRWVQFYEPAPEDRTAALEHQKRWVAAYLNEPDALKYQDELDVPADETMTIEQTRALHTALMIWPDAFAEGRGEDIRETTQLTAWHDGSWQTLLRKHELHLEVCEAAKAILDIDVDESDTETLFVLGYHSTQLGTPAGLSEAADAYRQYLTLSPGNAAVLNNLGSVLRRQGNLTAAAEHFEAALQADPNTPYAAQNLTRVQQAQTLAPLKARGIDLRYTKDSTAGQHDVARAYWDRTDIGWMHPLKDLQQRFGLSATQVKDTAVNAAWAYATNRACQDCGTPYEYTSRKDFDDRQRYTQAAFVCADCTKKRTQQSKAQSVQLEQERRTLLNRTFDLNEVAALDLNDLTLKDAVYLASVARAGASEDLRYINPLTEHDDAIGPTRTFSVGMLRHLDDRLVLRVHPASNPAAFSWEGDKVSSYDLTKVHWGIAMGGQQLPFGTFIEQLEARLGEGPEGWPDAWVAEMPHLWREIILDEALRQLVYYLAEHKLEFNPGEKSLLTMRAVLEDFTLAQSWNLSWRIARDAGAYYQRGGITRAHAANSAITKLKTSAEHHKANGWTLKPYGRNFNTPMPVVSQVLFIHALKLGVGYQDQLPPSVDVP